MKRNSPKIAVVLATSGLTSGCETGCVDSVPPPPALRCDDVDEGQGLRATATVAGQTLTAIIIQGDALWTEATVTDVEGASLVSSDLADGQVRVVLALDAPPPTSGSFAISGELQGIWGGICQVRRTFNFTVDGQGVQIAQTPSSDQRLPLAVRQRAEIRLVARDGRRIELEGQTSYRGPHELFWRAGGGTLRVRGGSRAEWELPAEPGFYQVELIADYGSDGLAIDWLNFQVT